MSKTLTFELPDEIYEALRQLAEKSDAPFEDVALEWLARHAHAPQPTIANADSEAAWSRLRQFAGAANSGDPQSADNRRIDADLAREYGASHQKAR